MRTRARVASNSDNSLSVGHRPVGFHGLQLPGASDNLRQERPIEIGAVGVTVLARCQALAAALELIEDEVSFGHCHVSSPGRSGIVTPFSGSDV